MAGSGIETAAKSLAAILWRHRGLGGPSRKHHISLARPITRTPAPSTGRTLGRPCHAADDCGFNTVCRRSTCRCGPGWDECGTGRCHFLPMSHAHCGSCGSPCGPDQLCSNGRCV